MAPEMALGGPVDARTDVYLLGATLHHVLTGHPRHLGGNARQAMQAAILSEPHKYRPTVPAELAALANAATAREPDQRPKSAAELRRSVGAYLRHKSSLSLAHTAAARLLALRKLAGETTMQAADERQREQDVLFAEARLALKHALDEWPENPEALVTKGELEQLLSKRHARSAELERLARELDPTVSHRQRQIAMTAVGVVGVGLSVSSFVWDRSEVTPMGIFLESLGPVGIVVLNAVIFRRHLFRTALNRRSVVGLVVAVLGVTASRALGLLAGATSAQILARDSSFSRSSPSWIDHHLRLGRLGRRRACRGRVGRDDRASVRDARLRAGHGPLASPYPLFGAAAARALEGAADAGEGAAAREDSDAGR